MDRDHVSLASSLPYTEIHAFETEPVLVHWITEEGHSVLQQLVYPPVRCEHCDGSGSTAETIACPFCAGEGWIAAGAEGSKDTSDDEEE
jgi:hypothetical protein